MTLAASGPNARRANVATPPASGCRRDRAANVAASGTEISASAATAMIAPGPAAAAASEGAPGYRFPAPRRRRAPCHRPHRCARAGWRAPADREARAPDRGRAWSKARVPSCPHDGVDRRHCARSRPSQTFARLPVTPCPESREDVLWRRLRARTGTAGGDRRHDTALQGARPPDRRRPTAPAGRLRRAHGAGAALPRRRTCAGGGPLPVPPGHPVLGEPDHLAARDQVESAQHHPDEHRPGRVHRSGRRRARPCPRTAVGAGLGARRRHRADRRDRGVVVHALAAPPERHHPARREPGERRDGTGAVVHRDRLHRRGCGRQPGRGDGHLPLRVPGRRRDRSARGLGWPS